MTVYTDGACQGNPGPGGWAWAVPGGRYCSGPDPATTNQRMEINAALQAVTALDGPLEVVSDSTYVVNCFRDRWWEAWLARGWVNKARKPVANRDLWEPLINTYRADPTRIAFRWVKGHGTDPINDLVDRLAVEAAATQVGRHGVGWPEHLGPADLPAPGPAGDVPPGHLVVVTGAKPPALGGYGDNPTADRVRDRLAQILSAKRQLHPDLIVLSGLGLGAEQLGTEAAAAAGIPYVAVLAFPEPDSVWPLASRQSFAKLLASAAGVVTLQKNKPATKQAAGGALARRDAWLGRHGAEAIVVWDGEDPAVGRTVRSLQDHLGEDEVWVLEP
jgi:ribonuclease HI